MRIIVVSDSHGAYRKLEDIFDMHREANAVIFLGDGERDMDQAMERLSMQSVFRVRGNCDFISEFDDEGIIEICGKRILYCHGHTYSVKFGYDSIKKRAADMGIDILLFGHTHMPYKDYDNGLYIMNPGSVHEGCYGMVDITDAGVNTILCEL